MHPADIQAALKKKGFTQKAIADELGVCPMVVSLSVRQVGHGSERARRAVAAKIGIPHTELFAEFYHKRAIKIKQNAEKRLKHFTSKP